MFLQFWILFMIVGLTLSMWIFYWAVKRGQFDEQERAKYLPLANPPMSSNTQNEQKKFVWSFELIALLIVVVLSLATILRMLFVVFNN